jgi:hypothetical protein
LFQGLGSFRLLALYDDEGGLGVVRVADENIGGIKAILKIIKAVFRAFFFPPREVLGDERELIVD